jgi:protein involved in polysaccharide export with SLBB domain
MKSLFAILLLIAAGCASKVQQSSVPRSEPAPLSVWVGGEVRQPGRIPWTSGMTAADAIRLAGGFTDFVSSRSLRISHWDGSKEVYRLTRDFRLEHDFVLRPGDGVYSPRR